MGRNSSAMPNVVDDFRPRPTIGDVIDERWRVLGRIGNSVNEIVLDVEKVVR
jgi:hypothetical protein